MPTPTCTTSCDADLPVVNFSDCNPVVEFSELRRIFVAKSTAAPFNDWTQAAEWLARMSQTSTVGDDYIRPLTVIGDKPVPTGVVKDISNGRRMTIGKDHVINFLIDDVSDENYDFMRQLECGGQFRLWYETEGGRMYGGNNGILVNMSIDSQLNRGREETAALIGVANYRAKFTEERTVSPIYNGNNGTPAPQTFDTSLTFAADDEDTEAGVTGTVGAADADIMLEFNAITPRVGTPVTMTIKEGGVTSMTVDFTTDYIGQYFRFTNASGQEHIGNFVNGTIDF